MDAERSAARPRFSTGRVATWATGRAAAAALLAAYWLLAVSSVADKSVTFDELAHVTAGYSYWTSGDFRLQPENGNLPQRVAGLPLVAGAPRFPGPDEAGWRVSSAPMVGEKFFFGLGNDSDGMLLRSRAAVALFGVATGLLVYLWSRRLFGPAGGIVSLGLFVFSPTILANGPLATSDMAAAFFFLASAGAVWVVCHRVSVGTVLASGLALGGLFVSKMSAPMIVFVGLALLGLRLLRGKPLEVVGVDTLLRRRTKPRDRAPDAALREERPPIRVASRAGQLAVLLPVGLAQVAIVALVIWASFDFRYEAFAHPGSGGQLFYPWSRALQNGGAVTRAVGFARDHRLLPEAYLSGFAFVSKYSERRAAFLRGRHSAIGWPEFFPYAFAVKTPLSVMAILGLALVAWTRRPAEEGGGGEPAPESKWKAALRAESVYRAAPLWVLGSIYGAFALIARINIGHRHLLPIYSALFILAGAIAFSRARWLRSLTLAALFALVVETLWVWPNYLAYFNQTIGSRRNAYKHLVDSSLDWGQELPALKRYLDDHGFSNQQRTPVYLSYFGTARVAHYGLQIRWLPTFYEQEPEEKPQPLRGGIYCISATMLQSVYNPFMGRWNRKYEDAYHSVGRTLNELRAAAEDAERRRVLKKAGAASEKALYAAFSQLRFARLCAYLRAREPDVQINYAILIYHLSDEDVRQALDGPPPQEMLDAPAVRAG